MTEDDPEEENVDLVEKLELDLEEETGDLEVVGEPGEVHPFLVVGPLVADGLGLKKAEGMNPQTEGEAGEMKRQAVEWRDRGGVREAGHGGEFQVGLHPLTVQGEGPQDQRKVRGPGQVSLSSAEPSLAEQYCSLEVPVGSRV